MRERQGALDGLVNPGFWNGRRVLLTGHTGFKGSWLALWLQSLGARVTGYSLPPPTRPSLFDLAGMGQGMTSVEGDVRDLAGVEAAVRQARPEVVIHMAAQSLVRASYQDPVETFSTNVMGTVHLLEAVRRAEGVRVVLVVTSDKCYENREWVWPYRESDPMGGHDPYSASKGCAELATAAWRRSWFADGEGARIASVRAGNVIGGGDWAADRLVPDLLRAAAQGRPLLVRRPRAVRPWQHVLEPLHGYLLLAQRLWDDPACAGAWNFSPDAGDTRPVAWVVERLAELLGVEWRLDDRAHPHEAHSLRLDSSRAREGLGWRPLLPLEQALRWIVEWERAHRAGADLRAATQAQISAYQALAAE